jgi:hypothetical protein
MTRIIALTTTLALASGCATTRDSLYLGIGTGAASGAVVGAIAAPSNRGDGALIGGLVGAVVGGSIAYFTQKGIESREDQVRKETLFNLEKFGVSDAPSSGAPSPSISFRVIEEQKIETHRIGNKVIEGHRVWILSDDSNVLFNEKSEDKAKKNDRESH